MSQKSESTQSKAATKKNKREVVEKQNEGVFYVNVYTALTCIHLIVIIVWCDMQTHKPKEMPARLPFFIIFYH